MTGSERLLNRPAVKYAALILAALFAAREVLSDWRLGHSYRLGENGDIGVYVGALKEMAAGGSLYGWHDASGYGFIYPPFAAILMQPLTWADPLTVGTVWLTVCVALAATLGAVVAVRATPQARGTWTWTAGLLGVGLFLATAQVQSDLITGQVNLLLALLVVADLGGVVPERFRGVLTGIAAAIKLTPAVAVGWLLLTRQWRAFGLAVTTFVVAGGLSWAVLPAESRRFWTDAMFDTWWQAHLTLPMNATVMGVLARAGADGTARSLLWLVIGAALVLFAYGHAARSYAAGDRVAAAVLLGCAAVVVTPVAWPHHQIWLPLAGLVLLCRLRPIPSALGALILVVAIFHVSLSRQWDRAGSLGGVFDTVDFAMFALVCLLGLGARTMAGPDPAPGSGLGRAATVVAR